MKKGLLIFVYTVIVLFTLTLVFAYFYNEYVLGKMDDGDYSVNDDILTYMNFTEPYIAYYNNGNIFFEQEEYEKAIEQYEKALTYDIPEGLECSIRINLALAMAYSLGDDYAEHPEESIEVLEGAIDVLLEENCATEEGDGHSRKAEKLKEELEEIIEELKNPPQDQNNPDTPPDTPQSPPPQSPPTYDDTTMQDIYTGQQYTTYEERQEQLEVDIELSDGYNYDWESHNW